MTEVDRMGNIEHWLAAQHPDAMAEDRVPITENRIAAFRDEGWAIEGPFVPASQLQGAVSVLEQIVSMADRADSPSHSMQGRANAWAGLGDEAVRLARAYLGGQ